MPVNIIIIYCTHDFTWCTLHRILCTGRIPVQSAFSQRCKHLHCWQSVDAKKCSYAQHSLSQQCSYANRWLTALFKTVSTYWRPLTWRGSKLLLTMVSEELKFPYGSRKWISFNINLLEFHWKPKHAKIYFNIKSNQIYLWQANRYSLSSR